jgi:hypothetical protein
VKPSTLVAVVLIVAGLVATWWPVRTGPEPIPAPADDATRAAVSPVGAALAGHTAEARQLAAFYHAAADCVRRDGAGQKVLAKTSYLRTFLERSATVRFQGAFAKVPGLADAIHGPGGALAKLLKLDVADLDYAKAAAALEAIAWACQEAGR